MCILSYLPPKVAVDEDGLLNGGLSNPDGHGWAVADGSTVIVGKSLSLIEALDDFMSAREKHPNSHALFHSRWATHGSVSTANVHPFYVGGSQQTVVAHNGILPRSAHPTKGDDRSDTRLFADDILSTRYRRLNKPTVRTALGNWIGSGNKLVILTVDPRYHRNAFIINEHLGVWDRGTWHSNRDYETYPWWLYSSKHKSVATLGTSKASTDALEIPATCFICELGHEGKDGYCTDCGSCQDCFETRNDCLCFNRYVAERDATNSWDQVPGWGDVTGSYVWQRDQLVPIEDTDK